MKVAPALVPTVPHKKRHTTKQAVALPWMASIPSHWQLKPVRHLVSIRGGCTPQKDKLEYWDGGMIPWVTPKDMKRDVIRDSIDHVTDLAIQTTGLSIVSPPAVLVVVRGMILAHSFPVGLAASHLTINQDMKALIPLALIQADYLAWAFRGLSHAVAALIEESGHGTRVLRTDLWKNFPLPVPPLDEQKEIARFLDRETAKIDQLIAKKKSLLNLLRSRRAAFLSTLVTTGLHRATEKVDSGVEWLGRIPKNWRVLCIATCASKITNGYVGPTRDILVPDGVPYLQSLHIKDGKVVFDGKYFVTPQWSSTKPRSILQAGDVLVVQTGDIGQVAVVPREHEGSNCHALIVIACRPEYLLGTFLALVLDSDYGFQCLKRVQTGALHPHLNCTFVREIFVPVPPLDEQSRIVDIVRAENQQYLCLNSALSLA